MVKHPLPMRMLAFVQHSPTRSPVTRKRRLRRCRSLSKSEGAGSVLFAAEAFEAERMVAIRADDAAIPEPCLAVLAALAEMFRWLGSATFGAGHGGLLGSHDIERK